MAKLEFPLQFKRQYADAIDADYKFTTEERQAYLTNPLRYAGMPCYDITEDKPYYLSAGLDAWLEYGRIEEPIFKVYVKAGNPQGLHYIRISGVDDYNSNTFASTLTDANMLDIASVPYNTAYNNYDIYTKISNRYYRNRSLGFNYKYQDLITDGKVDYEKSTFYLESKKPYPNFCYYTLSNGTASAEYGTAQRLPDNTTSPPWGYVKSFFGGMIDGGPQTVFVNNMYDNGVLKPERFPPIITYHTGSTREYATSFGTTIGGEKELEFIENDFYTKSYDKHYLTVRDKKLIQYELPIKLDAAKGALSSGSNFATGTSSVALGNLSTASGNNSVSIGNSTTASGPNSAAFGTNTTAFGSQSTAIGNNTRAGATGTFTSGTGQTDAQVIASGWTAFNHNFVTTPGNVGAAADYSAILGGVNNQVLAGATGSAIIGGVNNVVSSNASNSIVLCGQNITANVANTLFTNNIRISGTLSSFSGQPLFAPVAHVHYPSQIEGLQALLDAKADTGHTHAGMVKSVNGVIPDSAGNVVIEISGSGGNTGEIPPHTHYMSDITYLQSNFDYYDELIQQKQQRIENSAIDNILYNNLTVNRALVSSSTGKIAVSAVTSTQLGYLSGVTSAIQTQLNGKAATSHTHTIANVTNLQTTLDGKAATVHTHSEFNTFVKTVNGNTPDVNGNINLATGGSINWSSILEKPTTFTPSDHTHFITDISGLEAELDSFSSKGHGHSMASIYNLDVELAARVKTVNGVVPDASGNVAITVGGGSSAAVAPLTLSIASGAVNLNCTDKAFTSSKFTVDTTAKQVFAFNATGVVEGTRGRLTIKQTVAGTIYITLPANSAYSEYILDSNSNKLLPIYGEANENHTIEFEYVDSIYNWTTALYNKR
ncbi:hypothetical protein FVR03_22780 [Pontibacter qinzhouensis]|uniref:Trimeric autotransporter adhesin YadA-like head domain-containing protein n=1 Tax=Pontibacter qinzhouensis TaxID=2603253 RepID=A0A5C8IQ41_9BACT|nr:hypothetical protein [Pontibacter qinzhouensis]TXK23327.1 hypothetical protein FVR03_22780 [Pontibacter qinzhouensis]